MTVVFKFGHCFSKGQKTSFKNTSKRIRKSINFHLFFFINLTVLKQNFDNDFITLSQGNKETTSTLNKISF